MDKIIWFWNMSWAIYVQKVNENVPLYNTYQRCRWWSYTTPWEDRWRRGWEWGMSELSLSVPYASSSTAKSWRTRYRPRRWVRVTRWPLEGTCFSSSLGSWRTDRPELHSSCWMILNNRRHTRLCIWEDDAKGKKRLKVSWIESSSLSLRLGKIPLNDLYRVSFIRTTTTG